MITVAGKGKVGLIAFAAEESFPIDNVTDNILGYEVG